MHPRRSDPLDLGDASREKREQAANSLRLSPDRAAIPALLNMARNDPELVVRHAAVRALGAAGPEAVDGLIDLWRMVGDEEDRTLQLSAADSLVAIAKAAVPALVGALGDPSWRVRWMAIGALTRIGDRDALGHVRPLVSDPHSMIRDAAREANASHVMPSSCALFPPGCQPVRLLRAGTRTAVWLAVMPSGEEVVVKIATKTTLFDDPTSSFHSAAPEFFGPGSPNNLVEHEARVLRALDHPAVPRLLKDGDLEQFTGYPKDLDFETAQSRKYLIREFRPGSTIDRTELTPVAASIVVQRLFAALAYIHERGVVHRDIACSNVVIGPCQSVSLLDFELATCSGAGVPGSVGRARYRAPECWVDGSANVSGDLYAAGVVAYRLFTGVHPFDANRSSGRAHRDREVTDPRRHRPDIGRRTAYVIMRLLARHPSDRFPDAGSVVAALTRPDRVHVHTGRLREALDRTQSTDEQGTELGRADLCLVRQDWAEALELSRRAAASGAAPGDVAAVKASAFLGSERWGAARAAAIAAIEADPPPRVDRLFELAQHVTPLDPGIGVAASLRCQEIALSQGMQRNDILRTSIGMLVVLASGSSHPEVLRLLLFACAHEGLALAFRNEAAAAQRSFRRGAEAGRRALRALDLDPELGLHLALCDWANCAARPRPSTDRGLEQGDADSGLNLVSEALALGGQLTLLTRLASDPVKLVAALTGQAIS